MDTTNTYDCSLYLVTTRFNSDMGLWEAWCDLIPDAIGWGDDEVEALANLADYLFYASESAKDVQHQLPIQ